MKGIQTVPTVDVTGEEPVIPGLFGGRACGKVRGLAPVGYRVPLLVVVRESNEFDSVLMQGMVEHTLSYIAGRISAIRARELGIRPLTEGSACGIPVVELRLGRARACLFEVGGDYFLYAMTSAAKANEQGGNDWTNLLAQVLETLRPMVLQVAALSRLVRAFDHAGMVLHAVTNNVDEVHSGTTVMKMKGDGSEVGQLTWSVLAMIAASERNLIMQRLTSGTVAKYRREEWIKGEGAVPLGYRLDPISKLLVPDPDQSENLRLAFTWLANEHLTKAEIVSRLGDRGVKTKRVTDWYGPDATVSDLRAPEMYVDQLLRWAPLYQTGEHVTRWPNPFEGARHIAGMPVIKADGREELHFAYDFGRPDIDPTLVQAALAVRSVRTVSREQGGAARERVPALSRVGWRQGPNDFWLESAKGGTYELRVRAVPGATP